MVEISRTDKNVPQSWPRAMVNSIDFYKGLTEQTRAFVDSAAGVGIMNKTLAEATKLIESMASHNFS